MQNHSTSKAKTPRYQASRRRLSHDPHRTFKQTSFKSPTNSGTSKSKRTKISQQIPCISTSHPSTPPLSLHPNSPSPAPYRAFSRHLQQHLPEGLRQRSHVLSLPPPRVIPEERLMQQPRLEDVLQRRVEEASVAHVEQSSGWKLPISVPGVPRRA